ncbi:BON domain-containing protein [Pseudarthrobacter sp. PS3-L1]|uniref:BON domain-containing protein n=1 Tax=Pseudarthrobacter sp. PS3-L1 TaxID=3046207 RepID=UPI0024BA1065|nr:BON domain-containing protein [Pseudarthrobacter sp. PS3-L1]MDJ0320900.1 BON domain-containing protein [Pseudarthrobacter sp. PS3-L1]
MTATSVTRSDHDLQLAVQAECEWIPERDAAGIVIAVNNGAGILSGEVDHVSEGLAAQQAALGGRVKSWSEKEHAAAATRALPHVTDVKNNPEVGAVDPLVVGG